MEADRTRTPAGVPPWLRTAAAIGWRSVAVVVALAIVTTILTRLQLVVVPVLVAIIAAALFSPIARWLERRRVPPSAATAVAVLGGVAVVVVVVTLVGLRIASQVDALTMAFEDVRTEVERWLRTGPLGLSDEQISGFLDRGLEQLRNNAGALARGVLSGTVLVLELVGGALFTLVLLFFFVRDGDAMWRWFLDRAWSDTRRDTVRRAGSRAWDVLSGYIRGLLIIATVEAAGIGLGVFLIGVPLAETIAVMVFLGAFVPIVGAFVSGMIAALIALVTKGLVAALLTVGVVVVMNQIDAHLLQPVVMSHEVPLHPIVILLVIGIGGILWGIAGAALAVPIAAAASAVGNELRLVSEEVATAGTPGRPAGRD